jgi:hypothetical protein
MTLLSNRSDSVFYVLFGKKCFLDTAVANMAENVYFLYTKTVSSVVI